MKNLFYILITFNLILIHVTVLSQSTEVGYEKGKIFFKIKTESNLVICDNKGKVNINFLPFLIEIKDAFQITSCQKPFYTANKKNPAASKLLNTYVVYFEKDEKSNELLEILNNCTDIEYAEKVPLVELLYIPNDSLYVPNILGANPMWLYSLINAETAWNYSQGNPAIKVAIIDNAIWTDHPDLQGKFVDIKDFADNDNNTIPYSSSNDALGRQWSHGTHVAGLAGAKTNNNRGIASIGFNISLMAYKMYNSGSLPLPNLTAGVQAIQWAADHGAHVINISWGTTNQMSTLQNAIDYAFNEGCVIVAAAGNNGQEQQYYPAAYEHVIAVTSVGMDDRLSYFSNYGSFVDLTAPGGYGPTDVGTWSPVSTTYHTSYAWSSILGNIRYDGKVGTSMAAPIVSGLCGLMLSLDSTLTSVEIEQILKQTSVNIDALNPSMIGKIGTGRINAGAAMEYVYNSSSGINSSVTNYVVSTYPNPCSNMLNVTLLQPNIDKFRLFIKNITGQIVYELPERVFQQENIITLDLSGLCNGLYFLQLISENQSFVCVKPIMVLK